MKPLKKKSKSGNGRPRGKSNQELSGMMKYLAPILKGVLTGLAVTTVILFLFAFIMSKKDLPFAMINPISTIAVVAGCLAAGMNASKKLRENGMLIGGICGLAIYLLMIFSSFLYSPELSILALLKLAIAVLAGAVGGVIGVNLRSKRK